jgi:DNA repair ATPase RecN
MKKSIFMLALLATALFTSCKSNTEKEADAVADVQEATENLDSVTDAVANDTATKANDAEWQTYKTEANATIDTNEKRIAELKNALQKPGKTFDAAYGKSIDALEERNASLKTKISDYENNQTDWASFKREFDSDMTELGQALKDLTVNNKK